jgi:hypothetical protein
LNGLYLEAQDMLVEAPGRDGHRRSAQVRMPVRRVALARRHGSNRRVLTSAPCVRYGGDWPVIIGEAPARVLGGGAYWAR